MDEKEILSEAIGKLEALGSPAASRMTGILAKLWNMISENGGNLERIERIRGDVVELWAILRLKRDD